MQGPGAHPRRCPRVYLQHRPRLHLQRCPSRTPVRLPARCPQRAPRPALGEVGRMPQGPIFWMAPFLYLRSTQSPALRPSQPGTPVTVVGASLDQDASLALRVPSHCFQKGVVGRNAECRHSWKKVLVPVPGTTLEWATSSRSFTPGHLEGLTFLWFLPSTNVGQASLP